jgi:hypothetical protein
MVLALGVLVFAAAPDPTVAEARAHFNKAERLYREAGYAEAIAEFEQAYRIRPHGVLFFNIGKCYEQLGDIPSALRNYRRYLHDVPEAKDRDLVSKAIGNLEKRLSAKGVQQLLVFAQPAGAAVRVDGKDLGPAPVSVELRPGPHRVVVTHEGYASAERDVLISPDHSLDLDLNLANTSVPLAAAIPETMPPPPPPPAVPPESVSVVPAAGVATISAPENKPDSTYRALSFVAAGGTLVGVGVGIGLGESALYARNQMTSTIHNATQVQTFSNEINMRSEGANIAYGAAAVCGVTALALYLLSLKGSGQNPPANPGTF